MKVYQCLRAFLDQQKATHNTSSMLDFDPAEVEFQINVAPGDGKPVPGKRSTYTDGLNEWWNIRSPRDADSDPKPSNYELTWPLELHAYEIGLTGWNPKYRRSDWVGFDFDVATGHAAGVGVTAEQLEAVKEAAQALPYVHARRSTGGEGLHFVVDLDGIATANHTEHAAVARAVLGKMSAATGFNFGANVDACGQLLWIWSKRQNDRSFVTLKQAECKLTSADVPNWQDHIDVVTRKRSKTKVNVPEKQLDLFERIASAHRVVHLEPVHLEQMDELERRGFACNWDADRHMLQTHTQGLAKLPHIGIYETNSPGTDPQQANCFAFPGDFGSWKIYRFSPGISEAKTWEQDGQGYTTCWFNRKPNLKTAARALGGRAMKNGGYEMDSVARAAEVASALGASIEVDDSIKHRKAVVNKTKDGRLTVEVAKSDQDPATLGEWNGSDKKSSWTLVADVDAEPKDETTNYDDYVRCLQDPFGKQAGWRIRREDGNWKDATASSVKTVLQSLGLTKPDAEISMGYAERHPWTLVSLPFHPEYLGARQWNHNAPQWSYQPAETDGSHPTWDLFLEHLGHGLDDAVANDPWCQENGVKIGAQWWLLYYATILRTPYAKLPYLALWGAGESGKSSAYEVFQLLVTHGVIDGKNYFSLEDKFNADFATAVLVYIDEHDLSRDKRSADKVKELVTAIEISLRKMRTDQCQVKSSLHLIHLSNFVSYFATTTGDCRAVIIHIPRPATDIAKPELHTRLKAEAPQFMRTITQLRLPPAPSRLALPVLTTADKEQLLMDREPLTGFLDLCELDPEARETKADLLKACNTWLETRGQRPVTQTSLSTFLANATRGRVNPDARMLAHEDPRRSRAYQGIRLKRAA